MPRDKEAVLDIMEAIRKISTYWQIEKSKKFSVDSVAWEEIAADIQANAEVMIKVP